MYVQPSQVASVVQCQQLVAMKSVLTFDQRVETDAGEQLEDECPGITRRGAHEPARHFAAILTVLSTEQATQGGLFVPAHKQMEAQNDHKQIN